MERIKVSIGVLVRNNGRVSVHFPISGKKIRAWGDLLMENEDGHLYVFNVDAVEVGGEIFVSANIFDLVFSKNLSRYDYHQMDEYPLYPKGR